MADNTTLNLASTAGDVIATDDIAGVKYQIVKIGHGLADAAPVHTSATNPLPVVSVNGIVSTANSTSANLAAGAAVTGTWEDVSEQSTIMLSIFASHASAIDGLSVQFSSNGIDADLADVFTVPAATGKIFSFGVIAKFFRYVYTNGATTTTALRIQTLLSRSAKKYSSQRPQDGRSKENDMEEELAYMMAFNGVSFDMLRSSLKGVQGANSVMVHDMKDTGRSSRAFMLDVFTAAPAAEALQIVVQWYNNAAVAGTTTPAVIPAGKILRLTSWSISTKSLATVGSAVMRIRANTAGLAVIGSPLVWSAEVGSRSGSTTVAMTGGTDQVTGVFPEGFEFAAGTGLGFTLAGYGPAGVLALQGVTRFQVYGYEY